LEKADCHSLQGRDRNNAAINQWRRTIALAQQELAPLLSRYTTHLVIVLLVALALSRTGIEMSGSANYFNTPTPAPHLGQRDLEPVTARGGDRTSAPGGSPLLSAPVPQTTLVEPPTPVTVSEITSPFVLTAGESLPTLKSSSPEINTIEATRREIITYTVRSGDTVSGIAVEFGLSPNTLIWSNSKLEAAPDLLKLGQELVILPLDGAYHSVISGDTLESIAAYYKVTVEDIVNFELNEIPDDGILTIGSRLVIPDGKKPYVARVVHHYSGPIPENAERGTGVFDWPTNGVITQGFWEYHKAIDIGYPAGTPIYASDSGYVAKVGWSDVGYGKMVLLDHGNGFQTLYGHMSVLLVEEGTSVAKGTLIGRMGSTGNSTGPHLHFEIRQNGVRRNPLIYLPTE